MRNQCTTESMSFQKQFKIWFTRVNWNDPDLCNTFSAGFSPFCMVGMLRETIYWWICLILYRPKLCKNTPWKYGITVHAFWIQEQKLGQQLSRLENMGFCQFWTQHQYGFIHFGVSNKKLKSTSKSTHPPKIWDFEILSVLNLGTKCGKQVKPIPSFKIWDFVILSVLYSGTKAEKQIKTYPLLENMELCVTLSVLD